MRCVVYKFFAIIKESAVLRIFRRALVVVVIIVVGGGFVVKEGGNVGRHTHTLTVV
jgi:hypothetical protein